MKTLIFIVGVFLGCNKNEPVSEFPIARAQDYTEEHTEEVSETEPTLINGREAKPGEFPEVVYISSGGGRCTATLVGERAILTAAHCASTGSTVTFQVGQTQYSARIERAPDYPGQDHDLALGLVDKVVTEAKPVPVGGSYQVGKTITLAGYGCIRPGGGGGNDGILRVGDTKITGQQSYDMVSSMPNGAALCFGDSGGPAFENVSGTRFVLGVNSKGNIKDTNYNTRTDLEKSKQFFREWQTKTGVKICGISAVCTNVPSPTPTPQPSPTPEPNQCKQEFMALGWCLKYF